MPDRRLVAIVTALLFVMGGLGAQAAEATLEQLRAIDQMLTRKDTRALWSFLRDNPQLMSGDDELAQELRRFCTDVTLGRMSCDYVPAAAVPPVMPDAVMASDVAADPPSTGIY